jgi:hypothetical protein
MTSHPVDVGHRAEAAILRIRGYGGEVDLFIVYCPDTDRVYVIPAEDVPARGMWLRIDPPRNNQRKRVRWACDYELPA